jgi:hypothetical protein
VFAVPPGEMNVACLDTYKQDPGDDSICRSVSGIPSRVRRVLQESSRTVETDVIGSVAHFTATGPRQVGWRKHTARLLRPYSYDGINRLGPALAPRRTAQRRKRTIYEEKQIPS